MHYYYADILSIKSDDANLNNIFNNIIINRTVCTVYLKFTNTKRPDIEHTYSFNMDETVFDKYKYVNSWSKIIIECITHDKDVIAKDINMLIKYKE